MSLGKAQLVVGVLGLIVGLMTLGYAMSLQLVQPSAASVRVWNQTDGTGAPVGNLNLQLRSFSPNADSDITGMSFQLRIPQSKWVGTDNCGQPQPCDYVTISLDIRCPWTPNPSYTKWVLPTRQFLIGFPGPDVWMLLTLTAGMLGFDNADFAASESCSLGIAGSSDIAQVQSKASPSGQLYMVVWAEPLPEEEEPVDMPGQTPAGGAPSTPQSQEASPPATEPAPPQQDIMPLILLAIAIIVVIFAIVAILIGVFT